MRRTAEFYAAEQQVQKAYVNQVDKARWVDYPMVVSIETYAKCNAACTFCPYPGLERIGQRLAPELVYRLVDEIATFPIHPARLNLSRVNEPFLDFRLMDYLAYAGQKLPNTALVLFTNGQALTDSKVDGLNNIRTFRNLTVSFNEHHEATYAETMGIDQKLTLRRLDALHDRYEDLNFSVALHRVGTSDHNDEDFMNWCRDRFPAFPATVSARFDWIGQEDKSQESLVPDSGCTQWFSLHILATGRSAFCCIDGSGLADGGSVNDHSLKELYNTPLKRKARANITSRRQVAGCRTCIHAMPAAAYTSEAALREPASKPVE